MIPHIISFIACHMGPADHFASFAEVFQENGYEVQFCASGPALKKLQDRKIQNVIPFDVNNLSLEEKASLIDRVAKSGLVFTDMAHPFDHQILQDLKERNIKSVAYYDNPEPFVPGGYSEMVAKAAKQASIVLFANAHLASNPIYEKLGVEINLPLNKRVGLGYYPLEQADEIVFLRKTQGKAARSEFFLETEIQDKDQKLLVYFGGNNTEYFEEAFPAFLSFLSQAVEHNNRSNIVIVFQQHPGAKQKNLDRTLLQNWIDAHKDFNNDIQIIFSNKSASEMLLIADSALYYQTSMGPLFALAGIPSIQVGHKVYEDILVKEGLCYVVTHLD